MKTITTCFEHDIFHNDLKSNVYAQVYPYKYYRLLTKYEFITEFFVGINSPPKSWLSLVESLFNIKHEYSLQTKIWKTIRKMYVVEFPFNAGARIQSTAYYWTVLKIHSENAQKGKDVLNFLKFKKNLSCLSFFNARTLQSSILTSANTDFKKNVSFWVIWNISKISQKNVYNETIWLTKHLYKNHFIHFS